MAATLKETGGFPLPLKHAAFAAIAAFAVMSVPVPTFAQQQIPTLNANGEGSVAVVPDIAVVTIGVTTRATTAREALDQNSADTASVIAAVQAEGVADRDIGTSGFSVSPVYEEPPRNAQPQNGAPQLPAIVGYQVSNTVRVTIRDVATSGGILDKVVSAGANQVSGIRFDVSDPDTPADEALKLAIADARKKAELMAEAAGVRLVRIINISGSGSRPFFRAEAPAPLAVRDVPVMPGEQTITANANVIWEIAPE